MARALCLGNGSLLINFDEQLNMRDLYWPYVGQPNHIGGNHSSLGVWFDGRFGWCGDRGWELELGYHQRTMLSRITARYPDWELELVMTDGVHFKRPVYVRRLVVTNPREEPVELRIFFHHDFSIAESDVGDTAAYDPETGTLFHYKRSHYFMMNGRTEVGEAVRTGFFQFTSGIKRFGQAEGTWRDAEDGELEGNAIAQGSVDSTGSFRLELGPGEEGRLYYWLAAGRNYQEVAEHDRFLRERGPGVVLERIDAYWRSWLGRERALLADLPEKVVALYERSLLVIRTHLDGGGAIIAATDSDILRRHRDHYGYLWPRDGALIAEALIRAGYGALTVPFFRFCADVLTEDGYLLHKYNPDGTLGSSWHPWYEDGRQQLPIQEDETGLTLYALWLYHQQTGDLELVGELYAALVRPAAEFMSRYRDPETGLPEPSYDLWEERRGVFTFTAAAVHAGLSAAAGLAEVLGEREEAARYREHAADLRDGIQRHLYSAEAGRYLRGYLCRDGRLEPDPTLESSLWGLGKFGVLPPDDERLARTMEAVREGLTVRTDVGGIARYRGDHYFRVTDDLERVPGNPWFVCTLWLCEWELATAAAPEDLERPRRRLEWAADHAMASGHLPEQLHPYSGHPLSVTPLTWSHAALVNAALAYTRRHDHLAAPGDADPADPPEPAPAPLESEA